MAKVTEHASLKGVPATQKMLSYSHLKRATALNSPLANFLKILASDDVYYRKWEFDGDWDEFWAADEDSGATPFAMPATQELGGVIVGATGASANEGLSLFGRTTVRGDKQAALRVKFSLSAVTDVSFEIGLVDAVTDKTLPVVTDVDTPATGNGLGDGVVVHMDTAQTLKTMALVAENSASGDVVKADMGILTPQPATVMDLVLYIDDGDASVIVNGSRADRFTLVNAVKPDVLLAPYLYFRTRTTASRTVKIHFAELMCERA